MNIYCYPHHISDFRRDTSHLSHEQKGVYRDLLDAYYFNGGNITSDPEQLARIISIQTDSERLALAYAITNLFMVKNGKLYQKRASEEIDKIREKSIKAKDSALSKHKKTNGKVTSVRSANGHANALLANSQQPTALQLATADEIWREEELPSSWHSLAESKGIPDEQIYKSWKKFKETTSHPFKLKKWIGWVGREYIN